MRILRLSLLLAFCWIGVLADHHEDHHGLDEGDLDDEDLALLQKMDELDEMIKLVSRSARSAHDHSDHHDHDSALVEDITDDKEMIMVMERVDLDNPANVEPVADVMRTLPGDVQLEFLMKKFMMSEDADTKESHASHHQESIAHEKRSADAYGGGFNYKSFLNSGASSYSGSSYAEPEPEYGSSSSRFSSHGYAEPESEPLSYHRFRRASEHSHAKAQEAHSHDHTAAKETSRKESNAHHHASAKESHPHSQETRQESHVHAHESYHTQEQKQETYTSHTKHGKFFKIGGSSEFEGQGPAGVLLQRSAEKHGFQDKLNQREGSHHQHKSGESQQEKIMEKLKETISKHRRRRETEEEDSESLPKKQPVAYLEF